MELLCSKAGSRVMDSLWSALDIQQKVVVPKELCNKEAKVQGDRLYSLLLFVCEVLFNEIMPC